MAKQGKLFVISGPSGVGKTALVTELLAQVGSKLDIKRVVTYTSRCPRVQERQAQDYHFISEGEFQDKIDQCFFVDWSNAYGAYYGCPQKITQDMHGGQSYILIVDRSGAQRIKKACTGSVLIGIVPPSLDVLEKRLRMRGTESPEQIAYRLTLAYKELAQESNDQLYTYRVINDCFEAALEQLIVIVKKELKRG